MYEQIHSFIDSLLNVETYNIPAFSCCNIDCCNIDVDLVYSKVISSKFRKTKLSIDTEDDVRNKIKKCVIKKCPLQFSVPFGAYKAWRLGIGFRPDWAEAFNLSYLLKYAANILQVYPYGVDFTFSFTNKLMYFVSDIPKEEAQKYVDDFKRLLELFNCITDKVRFAIVEINSLYNSEEDFYIDFMKHFLDNLVFWDEKYDDETKNRHLNSAKHNLYLNGERKTSSQEIEIQQKYFYYSALMTDAVDCLRERRKFNKEQEKIQLIAVRGPSKSINIGGCETSAAHFWVSRGVITLKNGKIRPYLYTKSNLEKLYSSENLKEIKIDSMFETINSNYKKILFIGGQNE